MSRSPLERGLSRLPFARILLMRKLFLKPVLWVTRIMVGGFAATSLAQSPATLPDSAPHDSGASCEKTNRAAKEEMSVPSCYYTPISPDTKHARAARSQGTVRVNGTMTTDGRLTDLKVVKSPGLGLHDVVLETLKKAELQFRDG
jgi:TonB family protein